MTKVNKEQHNAVWLFFGFLLVVTSLKSSLIGSVSYAELLSARLFMVVRLTILVGVADPCIKTKDGRG